MVSREIDFSKININDQDLQNFLEANNNSYSQARQIFNLLTNNNTNPLTDYGLSGDKNKFIILLLERILRNTNILLEQNDNLDNRLQRVESNIIAINQQGLEPIIQAGNNITAELKQFEIGFRNWNNKFDNFTEIFKNWDSGFKRLEENFIKLENFLTTFSKYWENNITKIEINLETIESHIVQWNDQIINIHHRIQNIENSYYNLEHKQFPTSKVKESTSKQVFKSIPSNNHAFEF